MGKYFVLELTSESSLQFNNKQFRTTIQDAIFYHKKSDTRYLITARKNLTFAHYKDVNENLIAMQRNLDNYTSAGLKFKTVFIMDSHHYINRDRRYSRIAHLAYDEKKREFDKHQLQKFLDGLNIH